MKSRGALPIGGDVGEDDQNVSIVFKGQVLCHRQRHLRRDEPLHNRVVGFVHHHGHLLANSCGFKRLVKVSRLVVFDTNRTKDEGKFIIAALEFCLS